MCRRTGLLLLALIGLLLGAGPITAQTTSGTLQGIVRDRRGRAIANAFVQVLAGPALGRARTTQEGRYALESLPAGSYEILAQKAGYASVRQSRVIITAGQPTALNFTLDWADPGTGGYEVLVTDATGAPLQGADVTVLSNLTPLTNGATDEFGSVIFTRIRPGSYNVQVQRAGFNAALVRNQAVRAGQLTLAEFRLQPDLSAVGQISGQVRDGDGVAVLNARVRIISGPTRREVRTNAEGRYELRELTPGRPYVLEASADGFSTTTAPDVAVLVRQVTVLDFVLLRNQVGRGGIAGRVRNERGEPLALALVDITAGPALGRQVVTGTDGRFSIRDLEPSAAYALSVRLSGFFASGRSGVAVEAGRTTVADFTLRAQSQPAGRITGTVTDAGTGQLLGNVLVEVVDGPSAGLAAVTNGSGQYVLEGLIPAGGYAVRFSRDGYQPFTQTFVNVAAGASLSLNARLTPRFTSNASLLGRVRTREGAAILGARVTLFAGPSAPLQTETDGEGRYAFRNLREGTNYGVRVERTGFVRAERSPVLLREGQSLQVDFTLERDLAIGAVSVVVQDLARRRIAGARIRVIGGAVTVAQGIANARGELRLDGIPAGSYTVEASAGGFVVGEVQGVVVNPNRTTGVTVTLLR